MKVLSVVCARSGSKGLANKCIAKIKNKMVIEYSVEYSLSLDNDVKTVVSTDIGSVIEYCKVNDIEYIKRAPELCLDETRIDDVLADAIEKKGKDCVYTSVVYGNIPTRYPKLFYDAVEFLEANKDYDAVLSMQNVEKFHPEWMYDYKMDVLPKIEEKHYRRQTLPQKMIHDGHTFLFKSGKFLKKYKNLATYEHTKMNAIFGDIIKPLIHGEIIADIDTEKDMKIAKAILTNGY